MSGKERVDVREADAFSVVPGNRPNETVLVFRRAGVLEGTLLDPQQVSDIVAAFIERAEQMAATMPPESLDRRLQARPIAAPGVALSPGRGPGEMLMTFRLGNLDLTFAVETTTLAQMCSAVHQRAATEPKPPSH